MYNSSVWVICCISFYIIISALCKQLYIKASEKMLDKTIKGNRLGTNLFAQNARVLIVASWVISELNIAKMYSAANEAHRNNFFSMLVIMFTPIS